MARLVVLGFHGSGAVEVSLVLVGVGPVSFCWRCFFTAFVAVAIEAFNGVKRIRHRSVNILLASNQLHEDFPSGFFSRVSIFLGHRTIQDTSLNGARHETKSGNDKLRQYSEFIPEPDSAPGSRGDQSKLKDS